MVGDGQRITVSAVAELELPLEVSAPQVVGRSAFGQWRTVGSIAGFAHSFDQAMAIEHSVDGAFGGNPDIAGQAADQKLANFACAPMRFVAFEVDDQAFDLRRELVGVAHGPARTIGEGLQPMFVIAVKDLITGLAGYAEIPTHLRHWLSVQEAGDKAKALFHYRTLLPRHPHLPLPKKSEKCNPCVRYEVSPMSQAGPIMTSIAKHAPVLATPR